MIVIERKGGVASVSENVSVTCGIKWNVPAADGMPEIMPVLGLSVTPVGSAPENVHVSGGAPPVAINVRLYSLDTVPLGSRDADVVVILGGVREIISNDNALVAVKAGFAESRTVKVWDVLPSLPARGMPLIVWVAASHINPFGKAG